MAKSVLVIGATGNQGQAVTKQLLQRGHHAHALTRDPTSAVAKGLASLGAVIHTGNLDSKDSINIALDGVDGVFLAVPAHPALEETHCRNVIEAARERNIKHIVYSSVARTGEHESFPGWSDDYPLAWYWKGKDVTEKMVRAAGFEHWTILRPAFFMENFCQPLCEHMFPGLASENKLQVAFDVDTRLDLVDVADIGVFAANAFESPAGYSKKEISLAAEWLTAAEIAATLGTISGKEVVVEYLSDDQATSSKERGHAAIDAQKSQREVGYGVDIEGLKGWVSTQDDDVDYTTSDSVQAVLRCPGSEVAETRRNANPMLSPPQPLAAQQHPNVLGRLAPTECLHREINVRPRLALGLARSGGRSSMAS
ncbi:hypothetical protein QQX98_004585 [Neonectria punicea]|uniref:NmrA-like domain-containing protein n=1 Tax=Neonectria punicea TaxID=979145 RepID=A0ABR1H8L6_9HYPO